MPGRFQPEPGYRTCDSCPAGSFSNVRGAISNDTCNSCEVGRVAAAPGVAEASSVDDSVSQSVDTASGWDIKFRQVAGVYREPAAWVTYNPAAASSASDSFSKLDELEDCRQASDGKLHMKMVWPDAPDAEWRQTSNPVTER